MPFRAIVRGLTAVCLGICLTPALLLAQAPTSSASNTTITLDRWNIERPLFLPDSKIPSGIVRSLAFESWNSGDDVVFYSAGDDKVVRQWIVRRNASSGSWTLEPGAIIRWPILRNNSTGLINSLAATRDGTVPLLAFGGFGNPRQEIRFLRGAYATTVNEPFPLLLPELEGFWVVAVDWHPQQPVLAACFTNGREGRLVVWDCASQPPVKHFVDRLNLDEPNFVRFSPQGDRLCLAGRTGHVSVRKFQAGKYELLPGDHRIEVPVRVNSIGWSADETWVLGSYGSGLIRGNAQTGKLLLDPRYTRLVNHADQPVDYVDISAKVTKTLAVRESATVDGKAIGFGAQSGLTLPPNSRGIGFPAGSQLEIYQPSTGGPQVIDLSRIKAMSACPRTQVLALSVSDQGQAQFFGKSANQIRLVSETGARIVQPAEPEFAGEITALAVSPDGKFLVAAGIDGYGAARGAFGIELRLWSLDTGKVLARFPTLDQWKSLDASSSIAKVSLNRSTPRETELEFVRGPYFPTMHRKPPASARPAPPAAFEALKITSPIGFQAPVERSVELWQWDFDVADHPTSYTWKHSTGSVGPFPLTRLSDGSSNPALHPSLRTFGEPISAVKFRLASGEEFLAVGHEFGILVWDVKLVLQKAALRAETAIPAVCRGYFGHEGFTTCLAVDDPANARLLISGSSDGTLCGWSLDGLTTNPQLRNELGVQWDYVPARQQVIVKSVDVASPGYRDGFDEKQELLAVKRLSGPLSADRSTWAAQLKQLVPGESFEAQVRVSQTGRPLDLFCTLLREPMWTLYPLNDGMNWAIWSPEGFFDATPECADAFGWQLNKPLRFASANLGWNSFRDQALFEELLRTHNRRQFLRDIHDIIPPLSLFGARVDLQRDNSELAEFLSYKARILRTGNEKFTRFQLWCNSRLLTDIIDPQQLEQLSDKGLSIVISESRRKGDKAPAGGGLAPIVLEPRFLRHAENYLRAEVESRREDGPPLYNDMEFQLDWRPPPAQRKPKLHFIGIGVTHLNQAEQWKSSPLRIEPLEFAANDTAHLALALQALTGPDPQQAFDTGTFQVLLWPDSLAPALAPAQSQQLGFESAGKNESHWPTKARIQAALERMTQAEIPDADDLVIVHLTGHGFDDQGAEAGASDDAGGFYFVTQDTTPGFANALTRAELDAFLRQLPCRTLLLVDACHSGFVRSLDRSRVVELLGPEILTSCLSDQKSYEDPAAGQNRGHGVFTAAAIEFLTGQQLRKSPGGQLQLEQKPLDASGMSIQQWCDYVQQRVPQLLTTLKGDNYLQDPQRQVSRTFREEATYLKRVGQPE